MHVECRDRHHALAAMGRYCFIGLFELQALELFGFAEYPHSPPRGPYEDIISQFLRELDSGIITAIHVGFPSWRVSLGLYKSVEIHGKCWRLISLCAPEVVSCARVSASSECGLYKLSGGMICFRST